LKRTLADDQVQALAAAWIDALRRGQSAADEEVHQSVVILTFAYAADTQWNFIRAAVDRADATIEELYAIAAGPFEGFMGRHGEEYIERVEVEAERSPKFREMLHGAWQHQMSDELWARVLAARGEATLP
jgi:hypothetical protein